MEGVFSSSMYASSIQMCKGQPPKAGHLLFISPLKELAVGHFHWAENGGTGRYQVSTGRSTPYVQCTGVGHMSSFETRASNSNGHLRTTGRDQVGTGRVWCTTVLNTEKSANLQGHQTWSTGRVRCLPDLSVERVAKPPHTGCTPLDAPRASGALR